MRRTLNRNAKKRRPLPLETAECSVIILSPTGDSVCSKACERCLRQNQRAGFGAAVEKREEKCGAPDAFFGHRKSYANAGGLKAFLSTGTTRFFAPTKKWGVHIKDKMKSYCNRSGIRIPQSFSDLTVRKIQPPLTRGLNRTEFTAIEPDSPSSVTFGDTFPRGGRL